jgi:hypothetical protein
MHDASCFLEVIDMAEIVPKSQGNRRQEQAGITATPVRHATIVTREIEHAQRLANLVPLAKLKSEIGMTRNLSRSAA